MSPIIAWILAFLLIPILLVIEAIIEMLVGVSFPKTDPSGRFMLFGTQVMVVLFFSFMFFIPVYIVFVIKITRNKEQLKPES